jgi:type IV pilus assembly protein PilY1
MYKNNRILKFVVFFLLTCGGLCRTVVSHAYTAGDFNAVPPFVTASAPPLVMLVMDRDDKLYAAAYNDASDLDEDGKLDVGYKPAIDYYGYFDSYKCYDYDAALATVGGFKPVSATIAGTKTCSGHWSGDWLNWATMSRMDTLRKVLYGGYRSVDTPIETVLRRTYIPQDAHSWGKEYESLANDGYLISDYTPLAVPDVGFKHLFANTSLSDNGRPLLRVLPNSVHRIWDWVAKERPEACDPATTTAGYNCSNIVTAGGNYGSYPADHSSFQDLLNVFATPAHLLDTTTITQINENVDYGNYYITVIKGTLHITQGGTYTFACDGDDAVEVIIDGVVVTGWYNGHGKHGSVEPDPTNVPPKGTISLAAGNHTVEFHHQESTGNDNYFLYWKGLDSGGIWQIVPAVVAPAPGFQTPLERKRYNVITPASTITDYTVQAKVCDAATSTTETNCKLYANGTTYKPTGILQRHGESDRMMFGLLTGSYMKNLSGGVLRKNISSIKDEIDTATGQFTAVNGIIGTINKLRVYGYNYGDYSYNMNCGWIANRAISEGECRMWGNPIGEMMYETLRYFGGKTPTASFATTGGDDDALGLPHPAWKDPYATVAAGGLGYDRCSKPFSLVISDINPSFDSDTLPGSAFSAIPAETIGAGTIESPLPNSNLDVKTLSKFISDREITAGKYYIGQTPTANDNICTAKDVTGFDNIRGLCPEEPTKQGSYYSAAVAYYGRIHDISTSANEVQNVITYAIGLSSPLPRIEISLGDPAKLITLVPYGKSVGGSCYGISSVKGAYQPTDNIAAFFVSEITPTYGKFRINYEDVEQGADHDQDALVVYEYQVLDKDDLPTTDPTKGTQVKVTLTSAAAAGCITQHLGYIISGTDHDGPYLEVRDVPENAADAASDPDYFGDTPPGVWAPAPDSAVHSATSWYDGVTLPLVATRTFKLGSGAVPAKLLENPLWYAAKWGGFEEHAVPSIPETSNNIPDRHEEWDKDPVGAKGYGVPDTYFYVTNPLRLEEQLNKSFADILRRVSSGTAASVISNSRSGEGAVYQSIFYPTLDPDDSVAGNTVSWVGDVNALFVDGNGNLREDTNGNGQLDVVINSSPTDRATDCGDLIVVYGTSGIEKFADCNGNSLIDKSEDTNNNGTLDTGEDTNGNHVLDTYSETTPVTTTQPPRYLWQAGTWLNRLVTDPTTQRTTYAPGVGDITNLNRRYIFTFIDKDQKMVNTGSGEQQPFTCPTLPSGLTDTGSILTADLTDKSKIYPYLNVYAPFEASAPSYIDSIRTTYPATFLDYLKNQSCREINYIRGMDQSPFIQTTTTPNYTIPAFRSRQYDYDQNIANGVETWRLGDIVYSTPSVVGRPAEAYHLLYRDHSYANFLEKYLNRRSVVYVGANDGMLHAFNAGFYDETLRKFTTQPNVFTAETFSDTNSNGFFDPGEPFVDCNSNGKWDIKGCKGTDSGITPFALGAELWAYVPFNLLPHLFWLTEPSYAHVYYVDQKPRIFDARIFFHSDGITPLDSSHPNGWGTVMVVGMRFGGGTVQADLDKTDGMSPVAGDLEMSSAFIIMDITNPENPPKVLAELKFPGLGYTTSFPTVIPMSKKGGSATGHDDNEWSLVFGSGPAESNGTAGKSSSVSLHDAASAQKAKLYVVNLRSLVESGSPAVVTLGSGGTFNAYPDNSYHLALHAVPNETNGHYQSFDTDRNAFISDPITVDYQLDYKADAVYFGTVSGNETIGWAGKMRRIIIDHDGDGNANPTKVLPVHWTGDSVLLDEEFAGFLRQPITAAINVTMDPEGNRWIYFGTGRFFTRTDAQNPNQQAYYGIKEPKNVGNVLQPWAWTTVARSSLLDVSSAKVFSDKLVTGVTGVSTWDDLITIINSDSNSGWMINFSQPRERNIGQAALLGGSLLFTTYEPSTDVCAYEGTSNLYAVYYRTGTAYYKPMLGRIIISLGHDEMVRNISLGVGLAATPNIHVGGEEGSRAYIQTSTGEIKVIDVENAFQVGSGVRSWKLFER